MTQAISISAIKVLVRFMIKMKGIDNSISKDETLAAVDLCGFE